MPNNFYYIYSEVKPAQCIEIASRNAHGEFLVPSADDCVPIEDDYLDKMKFYLNSLDTNKVLIGGRFKWAGKIRDMTEQVINWDIPNSTIVPMCPAFRADIWHKLGGIDCRFIHAYWDLDLTMRFLEYGFTQFVTPDVIWEELDLEMVDYAPGHTMRSERLFVKTGDVGRALLNLFWVKSPLVDPPSESWVISKKRLSPVEPFSDQDILTKTQGQSETISIDNTHYLWR
jgi:hypothetical protein